MTEWSGDTLCIGMIAVFTLVTQRHIFRAFFEQTGTNCHGLGIMFTSVNLYIWLVAFLLVLLGVYLLLKRLAFAHKLRNLLKRMWEGVCSIRYVRNIPLYLFYTAAIWTSYLLHFYLTFFCFDFTDDLSFTAGLVMFVVGSIAVVVPTPNGAGPWHYAVIPMMVLYGVTREDAGVFALLVHAIQTFLIILLGVYGLLALQLEKRRNNQAQPSVAALNNE